MGNSAKKRTDSVWLDIQEIGKRISLSFNGYDPKTESGVSCFVNVPLKDWPAIRETIASFMTEEEEKELENANWKPNDNSKMQGM